MRMIWIRALIVVTFVPAMICVVLHTIWDEAKHIPFWVKCRVIDEYKAIVYWWKHGHAKE